MNNYSLTIAGILVAIIGRLGQAFGVHTDSVTVDNVLIVISVSMQVIGVVMAYIGRVRHGDVTLLGRKDL
jgi:hypothetical protein